MRLSECRFRQGAKIVKGGFKHQISSALSMNTKWPDVEPASSRIVALAAFDDPEQFVMLIMRRAGSGVTLGIVAGHFI